MSILTKEFIVVMINFKAVYFLINDQISNHVDGVLAKLETQGHTNFTRLPISEILIRLFVSVLSFLASIYEMIRYFTHYPLVQLFIS